MILLDGQRLADVRALYDEQNLYLHYDIVTPTPFANVGTELPLCPFVSGAYVDFCVAPDWRRPQREKPQAGDVRIILALVAGGGPTGPVAETSPEATGPSCRAWLPGRRSSGRQRPRRSSIASARLKGCR